MSEKNEDKSVQDMVSRIVTPIFNKVLQEAIKNPMSVGGLVGGNIPHMIYFPHNYRLYIDFEKSNFKIKPTSLMSVIAPFKLRNSTELVLEDFHGCNICVKKNSIEIRNFIDREKKFRLPIQTGTFDRLVEIDMVKVNQSKEVLKKFIELYGGRSNFSLIGIWHEYKYWDEPYIDSLPQKMRWHTEHSKKVYREGEQSNIEFWNTAKAANFVDARALDSQVPKIEYSLNEIKAISEENLKATSNFTNTMKALQDEALIPLKEQIVLHLDVEQGQKDALVKNNVIMERQLENQKIMNESLGVLNASLKRNRPKEIIGKVYIPEHIHYHAEEISNLTNEEKKQLKVLWKKKFFD